MIAESKYVPVWLLETLLPHPSSPEFRTELESFREGLTRLAAESGELPPVGAEAGQVAAWRDVLERFQHLDARATDLKAFASCHAAADARNADYQRLEAELASLDPERERIATNIDFALGAATEDELTAMIDADEWLTSVAFYLRLRRQNARFRLPKSEEALASELGVDGLHAWGRLYDRLSGGLAIRVMERGEVVEKSPGQVLFDDPQRSVRENNFFAADKAWSSIAETCADALNHIAGTRLTLYRRLGLADHLEVPLHRNRMSRGTLEAMWSTIVARKGVLLKYLEAKARLLGLPQLAWYDLQAPLPRAASARPESRLTYDEACEEILQSFSQFSPDLGLFALSALENRWIEAENRPGKRQGGFCTGFPTLKESRIFMTFTDSVDSMSTLAHELGHAYHSHVLRNQPLFLTDYPMNLAETASTFAEAVLGERRLAQAQSRAERLDLLDHLLSDAVVFLMNIHARFLFEDRMHVERAEGELGVARLSELMLAAQQEAYLGALAPDGWNPRFWASKLHFYITELPFYNFPYTFGYLLSLGVYALAQETGGTFPEQYRQLLLATGCHMAEDAVRSTFGYDLSDAAFWEKSLDIIAGRVERFVAMADEQLAETS